MDIKNISKDELMKRTNITYKKYLKNQIIAKKGAVDLIRRLYKNGFLLAVASGSHNEEINMVLSKLKIKSFFNEIISSDDVKKAKPSPDIFLLTMDKLKVSPENCLVLEDSPNGVIAAKKAKMNCYAIISKDINKEDLKKADRILNDLSEVYSCLNNDFT